LDVPVIVGGVAGYTLALHLMRTGAAGVLVGFVGGASSSTRRGLGIRVPMVTSISDIVEASLHYMDISWGRYVHVISVGGLVFIGDIVKAIGMGADAVMLGSTLARATEAPGKGWHWGLEAAHPEFPRGDRTHIGTVAGMEELLIGPTDHTNGTANLMGALRRAMASTGYTDLKDFQKVEVQISPTYPG